MRISERLKTIATFVDRGSCVADIGADHGLLSRYLIDEKIAKSVFAVENKQGPFDILSKNVAEYQNITVSLSNGLDELPFYIDTIVIAGMGGNLITSILLKNSHKLNGVKKIIVDSHRDEELVVATMEKLNFVPTAIKIVHEKKFYIILVFEKQDVNHLKSSDKIAHPFEKIIAHDSLYKEYKKHVLERLKHDYKCNKSIEIKTKIERLEHEYH